MTVDDVEHHAVVVDQALRRLGRAVTLDATSLRLLAGGLSGAAVYRVDLAGAAVVLKITPASVPHGLLLRARHEALFYRDLATRVPVRGPRVLGLAGNSDSGIAILLDAHTPAPPPDAWQEQDFANAAREAGVLHATFRGSTAATLPGWLRARETMTSERCQHAAELWWTLGRRDDLGDAVRPVQPQINRLLDQLPERDLRYADLPATLCHGDFHPGNLLRSATGEWIWLDWQDVRFGLGVDDLTFFWQRAFAAMDTSPPYGKMVQAYLDGLQTGNDSLIDPGHLEQELAWSEVRSWLVDWPPFLGFLPPHRVKRIMERISSLLDRS